MLLLLACGSEPAALPHAEHAEEAQFREGDLIFQASQSGQAAALRVATGSKITHVGLIDEVKGEFFVIEAVEPVKVTPLESWRGRYEDPRVIVARGELQPGQAAKVVHEARRFLGRHYDSRFGWDDQRIYCSELVWKAWERALGQELVPLKTLGDFPLNNPLLKPIIEERWGKAGPDPKEPVVAPVDLLESPHLRVVRDELR